MKTAIIVDSTAGLTEPLISHPDIYQVNLTINFVDGYSMIDNVDPQKNKDFYQKLLTSETLPTTSQPQIGLYYELVDELINKGYERVFAIHLSGKISGTSSNAEVVIKENKDKIRGYVFDSKSASIAIEHIVYEMMRMIEMNLSDEEICQKVNWLINTTEIKFMVQDLYNLNKGGRLSSTGAIIGNMLKIKPILTFDPDGHMIVCDKIRTTKKVYLSYVDLVNHYLALNEFKFDVWIGHTDNLEEAEKLKEVFINEFGNQFNYKIVIVSPVLGTHTGRGLVGFGILPIIED